MDWIQLREGQFLVKYGQCWTFFMDIRQEDMVKCIYFLRWVVMGNSGISNFSIFQYFPWLGFLMTFEVPSGPHIKCADCVDFYYNDEMILHLLNYICYTINNQTGMHHIKTKNTLLSQSETDPVMNRKAVIPPPPIFLVASVLITREEMHMWSQRGPMLKTRGFTLNKNITTILFIHISIFTYPQGGSSTKLHWNTNQRHIYW